MRWFCHLCKWRLRSQMRVAALSNLFVFPPVMSKGLLGYIGSHSVFKSNTNCIFKRFKQYLAVFLFGKIYFRISCKEKLQKSKKIKLKFPHTHSTTPKILDPRETLYTYLRNAAFWPTHAICTNHATHATYQTHLKLTYQQAWTRYYWYLST